MAICDKNTLNSPSTCGLFASSISGYAFITMKPGGAYGHILFITDGTYKIYQTNYRVDTWSAWECINPDPVVLWTGKENTPGNIITLNDNITKYKYIDIYTNSSGNLAIQTFERANGSNFICKMFNIADNLTSTELLVEEIRLDITTNKTLTMNKNSCVEFRWSGKTSESATKANVGSNVYVYKIVGRMM